MSKIFIQNPTSQNVGVQIVSNTDLGLIDNGPAGAVVSEGNVAKICLAPESANINAPALEGIVNLEGQFVVQVNNEIIPYSFTANQLPHFFNGERPECRGILFDKRGDIYFKSSAGIISYQGNIGDTLTLDDGTVYTLEDTGINEFDIPAGNHKFDLIDSTTSTISLAGPALLEVLTLPASNLVNHVKFRTNVGSPNLITVPDELPSNITNLSNMFEGAVKFNGDLTNWNVSNVTDMSSMFKDASIFNGSIGNWNTALVTNMSSMFENAKLFNQPLNTWNTSNVTSTSAMFKLANAFNGNISTWDVGKVTDMSYMFYSANMFNGNIGSWNVSNVTDMSYMLRAPKFNQNISVWDTGNVTSMVGMFNGALVFNQNISLWNTSKVTNMQGMFTTAKVFNQPLNNWDVSNVTSMQGMFYSATNFNQDISTWNTKSVSNMNYMFELASAFARDLSQWCVPLILSLPMDFAKNSPNLTLVRQPVWGTCPRGENIV